MQEIKNNTEVPKSNKNILKQFEKLISDSFDLLRETLRFNDANINHEEVRNNIYNEFFYQDILDLEKMLNLDLNSWKEC